MSCFGDDIIASALNKKNYKKNLNNEEQIFQRISINRKKKKRNILFYSISKP